MIKYFSNEYPQARKYKFNLAITKFVLKTICVLL